MHQPGSGGLLLKSGLVVLSIGFCALGMLVLRQARLQAAHEVTQTQLRIQRADEQLWKMRADIAALSNPTRIRELAGNIGPMHALINPVEAVASPSVNPDIPMIEKPAPSKGEPRSATKEQTRGPDKVSDKPAATGAKTSKPASPSGKPVQGGEEKSKPAVKPTSKPNGKPEGKPLPAPGSKPDTLSTPRLTGISPTGLAAAPAPKIHETDR